MDMRSENMPRLNAPRPATVEMIETLVGFDTTSRNSNLEIIEFIEAYLGELGVRSELVYDRDRRKANLFASLGQEDRGGIVLSGHTDVVPVDGQSWDSDPYQVVNKDGRLYGRGTSDMKSFIGVCLAYAPKLLESNLEVPIHFAFSYDEEIGCIGVRGLLDELAHRSITPTACIVGEPTKMQVARAHKGQFRQRCLVKGLESHSGLPHRGVNAVEAAAEVVAYLKCMARRFRDQGPFDEAYDPPFTTVHTGTIHGGTALNIVPKECEFEFEFRYLPQEDPRILAKKVREFAEQNLLPEMQAVFPEAGFTWEELAEILSLDGADDTEIAGLAKTLAGVQEAGKISFGTEAGLYARAGIPTVVCGPGNIEQAHKPNEYISLSQVAHCETFIEKLVAELSLIK